MPTNNWIDLPSGLDGRLGQGARLVGDQIYFNKGGQYAPVPTTMPGYADLLVKAKAVAGGGRPPMPQWGQPPPQYIPPNVSQGMPVYQGYKPPPPTPDTYIGNPTGINQATGNYQTTVTGDDYYAKPGTYDLRGGSGGGGGDGVNSWLSKFFTQQGMGGVPYGQRPNTPQPSAPQAPSAWNFNAPYSQQAMSVAPYSPSYASQPFNQQMQPTPQPRPFNGPPRR